MLKIASRVAVGLMFFTPFPVIFKQFVDHIPEYTTLCQSFSGASENFISEV